MPHTQPRVREYIERHPDRLWVLRDRMGQVNSATLGHYVKHSPSYYEQANDDIVPDLVPGPAQTEGAVGCLLCGT